MINSEKLRAMAQEERLVKDLEYVRDSIRSDLDRLDRLILKVRTVLNVSSDKTPEQEQAEELYRMLYDLCFDTVDDGTYITQAEMYGYFKMSIMKSDELLQLCKSYGWSEYTPNCPLWRKFMAWVEGNGHKRIYDADTRARLVLNVHKRFWDDWGKAQIESILKMIPLCEIRNAKPVHRKPKEEKDNFSE